MTPPPLPRQYKKMDDGFGFFTLDICGDAMQNNTSHKGSGKIYRGIEKSVDGRLKGICGIL